MPISALAADQPPSHSKPGPPRDKPGWNQPLSPDEHILQLLNRITFGPRAGDVDRVRQIGLRAFLDQQLRPGRISDSAVEARLMNLPTLTMSSQELVEKYPAPRQVLQNPNRLTSGLQKRALGGRADISPATQGTGSSLTETMGTPSVGTTRPSEEQMNLAPDQMRSAGGAAQDAAGGSAMVEGPQRVTLELAQEELLRAVYSERQLQEVMVQFWMNHFNIFAPKGADRWLLTSFERDTIRPHALGNFEDLLLATAKSPAMLFYLDNWQSAAPNANLGGRSGPFRGPARFGRRPVRQLDPQSLRPQLRQQAQSKPGVGQRKPGLNENYGRELMELHTLGVSGGYTQKDVIEVARCLTGWSIDRPQQGGGFIFRPQMHDYGQKVVLGHIIPAGGGIEDGLQVVYILAHQPATAHYISLKLCRRFVADDPPDSVVDRAAKTFLKSNGDIRKVLKSILTSREFYSQAAYRAKVKSPLELVASSLRALGAQTEAGPQMVQFMARMGEPMFQYQAPTGFPDRASTWINSSTLLARMKYAMALAANRIRGTKVNWSAFSAEGAGSYDGLLDKLNKDLLEGSLTAQTRQAILARSAAAPEFQRR
jgi:uncharacterized protein (DUF1800 family)